GAAGAGPHHGVVGATPRRAAAEHPPRRRPPPVQQDQRSTPLPGPGAPPRSMSRQADRHEIDAPTYHGDQTVHHSGTALLATATAERTASCAGFAAIRTGRYALPRSAVHPPRWTTPRTGPRLSQRAHATRKPSALVNRNSVHGIVAAEPL